MRLEGSRRGWTLVLGTLLVLGLSRAGPVLAQQTSGKPRGRPVTLTTRDGFRLFATYWPGTSGGRGVVFVHGEGRSSEDWRRLGERFAGRGIHAIAMDLRGHGRSTTDPHGKRLTYDDLTPEDFKAMVEDVRAAVRYLRDKTTVNPDQIALLGASLGANLAIQYAAEDPRIANVLLLSPGLEYHGVSAENAIERYGSRPLFIAVSREDRFSAKTSLVLDAMARGKKYLKIYTGAGHGARMLTREPSLEPTLYRWISGTLLDDPMSSSLPATRP